MLLAFDSFLHYVRTNGDRNPFVCFDAMVLDPEAGCAAALSLDYTVPTIFAETTYRSLPVLERPPYQWLIVAPARSGSPMHTDPPGTSAWNALLVGAKHWVLCHPATPAALLPPTRSEDGEAGLWEDLASYFHDELPLIRAGIAAHFGGGGAAAAEPASALHFCEFVQHPSEVVFVPAGWHHASVFR